MNIKEELTCIHCDEIYKNPITLNCCGDNICKHHIEELISKSALNKFTCPFCNEEHSNQDFKVNTLIEKLIKRELQGFNLNPKYEKALEGLKIEIKNLATILNDPENYIDAEINELKRQVDLDRERLKSEMDKLADGLIHQLESFGNRFKTEYKTNVDLEHYNSFVVSSKKQLEEYQKFLGLLSVGNEERDEKSKENEKLIVNLKLKANELKKKLFLNESISYNPIKNHINKIFGKLVINVSFHYF